MKTWFGSNQGTSYRKTSGEKNTRHLLVVAGPFLCVEKSEKNDQKLLWKSKKNTQHTNPWLFRFFSFLLEVGVDVMAKSYNNLKKPCQGTSIRC